MYPYHVEVVARGTWKYDGVANKRVGILRYPAEHAASRYNEDDELDESRPVPASDNGFLYRLDHGSGADFASIQDAMLWANEQPWGPVEWHSGADEASA